MAGFCFSLFLVRTIIINTMEKSNLEIRVEHIEKVVDSIQRDVKDIAKLGADTKALVEGMSQRVNNAERKADKVENRLRY